MKKILLIDHHDSFTYNLVELLRQCRKISLKIIYSEDITEEHLGSCDKIMLSPGPGHPLEYPRMEEILHACQEKKPVLGICLGLQAIAVHYGSELYNLGQVVHGQSRQLIPVMPRHYLFRGIPDAFPAGLYHSWAVKRESLAPELDITVISEDGIIMGLAHKTWDVCGIQFHPESHLTPQGKQIVDNWLAH